MPTRRPLQANRMVFRLKAVICLLIPSLTAGCILPIPTVPLNLPAHGHTWRIRDSQCRPVSEGIFVIHTYYYHEHNRIDCYPLTNGTAVIPTTRDVRVVGCEMFGYFSWIVPTYYIFFINAHHAHAYPFVPGHVPWYDFSPLINDGLHTFGLKPRPEVMRVFPVDAATEIERLLDAREEFRRPLFIAQMHRTEGESDKYVLHNERQALKAVAYIDARLKALSRPPTLADALKETHPATKPTSRPVASPVPPVRFAGLSFTPSERAFRAMDRDDNKELKYLLEWGLDANSYDVGPWTLLHRAIDYGNTEAVRLLIDHGADVNRILPGIADHWYAYYDLGDKDRFKPRDDGYSPLALAAAGGHLEIVLLLRRHGAKVRGVGICGHKDEGYTLLHAAAERILEIHGTDGPARRRMILYAISQGDDVNAKTTRGLTTPLHNAAAAGFVRTAKLLIERGANVNVVTDTFGWTPLHLAARAHQPAMCELLLRHGADISARDKSNRTALSLGSTEKTYTSKHPWQPETIRILKEAENAKTSTQKTHSRK